MLAIRRILGHRLPRAFNNEMRYQDLMAELKSGRTGSEAAPGERVTASVEVRPDKETELILCLTESFNCAKQKQSSVPNAYLPDHEWKRILEAEWQPYYKALSRRDVPTVAKFLRNFFRNEGISGFWGGTGVFEIWRKQKGRDTRPRDEMMMRQFLVWRAAFPDTPLSELDTPKIGNPWDYDFGSNLLVEPVFEHHFQANYFRRLLSEIEAPVVLEIGGGFGGLAFHLMRPGGRLKYIGLDLPENVLIQSYYLACAFPNARILTYSTGFAGLRRSTLDNYDIVLLPNFTLPDLESSMADLIANVRSLSEMSSETIGEYLKQVNRVGSLFFFHENIFLPRKDTLFGIPSSQFPAHQKFRLIAASESRWPKYQSDSLYPCQENLFIHSGVINGVCSKV